MGSGKRQSLQQSGSESTASPALSRDGQDAEEATGLPQSASNSSIKRTASDNANGPEGNAKSGQLSTLRMPPPQQAGRSGDDHALGSVLHLKSGQSSASTMPPSQQASRSGDNYALSCLAHGRDPSGRASRWRPPGPRIKTAAVGLVMCLHVGIDPPDLVRPEPGVGARLECWLDPGGMPADKAREAIARTLQQQYEYWQPRARYRTALDPTADDLRKLIGGLRRAAGRGDRVAVHYNGHGVPRPTRSGELWLFNRQFTQYIPLHVRELAACLEGGPGLLIFDCSSAGYLLNALLKSLAGPDSAADPEPDLLVLGACGPGELLPLASGAAHLPADLFTACLTTPMEVALRIFPVDSGGFLAKGAGIRALELPGRLQDKQSVLGELNWILTAILDCIAWQVIGVRDRLLFQRLFRQDLLVAALFKNYLLACRVMRPHGCTPVSHPVLPIAAIATHPLWQAWAFEVDRAITMPSAGPLQATPVLVPSGGKVFFSEQHSAFDKGIGLGRLSERRSSSLERDRLPIILQILLSQQHRSRALFSFLRYMEVGGELAVEEALQVGLFPYILKLLQSPASDIRVPLLWLWFRVLCFDRSCWSDLCKDDAFQYFAHCAWEAEYGESDNVADCSGEEPRTVSLALLVLFVTCAPVGAGAPAATAVVTLGSVVDSLWQNGNASALSFLSRLSLAGQSRFSDDLLAWKLRFLAVLLSSSPDSALPLFLRETGGVRPLVRLLKRADDPDLRPSRLVRTAATWFLGVLLAIGRLPGEDAETVLLLLAGLVDDPSGSVREEAVVALSQYVAHHFATFTRISYQFWQHEKDQHGSNALMGSRPADFFTSSLSTPSASVWTFKETDAIYRLVWQVILCFAMDPSERISRLAGHLVDEIHMSFLYPAAVIGGSSGPGEHLRRTSAAADDDHWVQKGYVDLVRDGGAGPGSESPTEVIFVARLGSAPELGNNAGKEGTSERLMNGDSKSNDQSRSSGQSKGNDQWFGSAAGDASPLILRYDKEAANEHTRDLRLLHWRQHGSPHRGSRRSSLATGSLSASDDESRAASTMVGRVEVETVLPMQSNFPSNLLDRLLSTTHYDYSPPPSERPVAGQDAREAPGAPRPTGEPSARDSVLIDFVLEDALASIGSGRPLSDWIRQHAAMDCEQPIVSAAFAKGPGACRLVTANPRSFITVWQQQQHHQLGGQRQSSTTAPAAFQRTNVFRNGKCGPIGSFLPLTDSSSERLLTVASADGGIRLWRHFEYGNEHLASAWMTKCSFGRSPLLSDLSSRAIAFTDEPELRAVCTWDLGEERLVFRKTLSDSISSLTSINVPGSGAVVLLIGTEQGRVLQVDPRASGKPVVDLFKADFPGPIRKLSTVGGERTVNQGGGLVFFTWEDRALILDTRKGVVLGNCLGGPSAHSDVQSAAAHPRLPLLMAGCQSDGLSLHRLTTEEPTANGKTPRQSLSLSPLGSLRHNEGLLGRRIGRVSQIIAHPELPMFAAITGESALACFSILG